MAAPPPLARVLGGELMSARPLLAVEGLGKRFGGLEAVSDVSFEVTDERVVGVIGPNGSGKTTLFNLISRVLPASAGRISLRGADISRARPDEVFQRGMSRTFQNVRLFGRLTVLENMLIAARSRDLGAGDAAAGLEAIGLSGRAGAAAASLAYGEQKLLEIAMSLLGSPAVVLLDEPLAGVHEDVVDHIRQVVAAECERTTFLLVEHNVGFVMDTCERVIVMDRGRVLADGTPDRVRADEAVIAAYLGSDLEAMAAESGAS